jgi:hypothetical protein
LYATSVTSSRTSPLGGPTLGFPALDAVQAQRQRDVLDAGQLRHQLPELEDEPELAAAQCAALGV